MVRYDIPFRYFTYPYAYLVHTIMCVVAVVVAAVLVRMCYVLVKRSGYNIIVFSHVSFFFIIMVLAVVGGVIGAFSNFYRFSASMAGYNPKDWDRATIQRLEKQRLQLISSEIKEHEDLMKSRPDIGDW